MSVCVLVLSIVNIAIIHVKKQLKAITNFSTNIALLLCTSRSLTSQGFSTGTNYLAMRYSLAVHLDKM